MTTINISVIYGIIAALSLLLAIGCCFCMVCCRIMSYFLQVADCKPKRTV